MTFPLDASGERGSYSESLRTVDTNPTSVFTPVGQVMAERTILVAEDDTNTRRALQHYLKRSGYDVREAANVDESLEAVFAQPADLVILDFDIGGGTADVLTTIRRRSSVPIIVCSGRSSERDRVALLNLGADDVLTKPYSFAELEARMRAVLRRGSVAPTTTLDHGDLVIDQGTRKVTINGVEVAMTRKEFDLLAFLASAPGRVFSREDLLERVWGSNGRWQGRSTVTEHIRRVRLKIEVDPEHPRWITTIRGIGYRFAAPRRPDHSGDRKLVRLRADAAQRVTARDGRTFLAIGQAAGETGPSDFWRDRFDGEGCRQRAGRAGSRCPRPVAPGRPFERNLALAGIDQRPARRGHRGAGGGGQDGPGDAWRRVRPRR